VRFPFEVFWERAVAKLGTHKLTRCRPNGVLIVDDSALIKTGRKMAEVRKLFDHSKKQFARGISYVQLYYLDRAKQYPLFFELHSKRGRRPKAKPHRTAPIGKIRIALRLLDQAIAAGIRPKAVLFDAWFLGTAFLKELHKLRLPFVSRLSSNRNLIVNGRTVKTKRLLKQKQRYRYSRSLKARWFALPAILPGYGPVLVVCLKHKRRKTAIVSNLLSADPCALVELYRQRWAIETFFKEAKQVFGLDKFQNRKRHGILAHLVLTNLSCLLVALLKLLLPGARSMKLKMLFRSLFRIVADLTFQNGTLIIIIGKTRRWFAKTVSFFNDLQPLASTA